MTAVASRETTVRPAPPERARGAGHLLAPMAVAVLAAAGAWLTWRVFIRTSLGQLVDTAALRGGDVQHPKVVEVLSRALNGTTLVSVVAVCVAAATIGILRKRLDLAIGAAVMVIGSNATVELLKGRLARPTLDGLAMPNSFPSGHTAAACSVVFALILVLPHRVRETVALIGFGYVSVIAIATVWAEWHRPSDTIAAVLVVLGWGAVVTLGIRLARLGTPGQADRISRLAKLPLLAVSLVTGLAGVLGLAAVAMSERGADLVSARFAFLTGCAVIACAAASSCLFWVRLSGTR